MRSSDTRFLCVCQAETAPEAPPALASKTPTEAAFEQHFLQNQASWAEQRQSVAEKRVRPAGCCCYLRQCAYCPAAHAVNADPQSLSNFMGQMKTRCIL